MKEVFGILILLFATAVDLWAALSTDGWLSLALWVLTGIYLFVILGYVVLGAIYNKERNGNG